MNDKEKSIFFMEKALRLAEKGQSWTSPNPMVGAVIVKNNKTIGEGYHRQYGQAHAEIEALKSTHKDASGSTMYVTLEPCCHTGKTPPCVESLIQAKIKKVVCSHLDPNPLVAGKGIEMLRSHGIQVETDIMNEEAMKLNENFITFHTKKRPFIAVKFACSLDGKIATSTGDSKWITNKRARSYARKLRSNYQAILVGRNTVLQDNPHLGCRDSRYKDPIRIVLDSQLHIPLDYQIYRDSNVIVATTRKATQKKLDELHKRGIKTLIFDDHFIPIEKLVSRLWQLNVVSIFVEGGSEVIGSFIDKKLVDKVYIFQAPILIGGNMSINAIGGKGVKKVADAIKIKNMKFLELDDNTLTYGYIATSTVPF